MAYTGGSPPRDRSMAMPAPAPTAAPAAGPACQAAAITARAARARPREMSHARLTWARAISRVSARISRATRCFPSGPSVSPGSVHRENA